MKSIILFLLMVGALSCQALTLVEDGRPKSCIVVSSDAPESVKFAGRELQKHIFKASGAELPLGETLEKGMIPIYLGRGDWLKEHDVVVPQGKSDGFVIQASSDWLIIAGRDYYGDKNVVGTMHPFRASESYLAKDGLSRLGETGTLFGVYEFLRDVLGVRWYMPGKLGTVIPEKKTITVSDDFHVKKAPDFAYRYLYHCDFSKDPEAALWYRRIGCGGPSYPVFINHTFHLMRKYEKSNPEIFALINGKRDFSTGCMGAGNLCLSNPETKTLFVEYVQDFFDKNPEKKIFPVMPNDSFIQICECERCQRQIEPEKGMEGKFSEYVWKFVNDVAEEIKKSHPDKCVACGAYSTYMLAPEKIGKLNPNVVVMICKKRREYSDKAYRKNMDELISVWKKKIEKGNLYFWEYYNWIMTTPYCRNVPVFYPGFIGDELKKLKGWSGGEFIEAENWDSGDTERMNFPALTHLNFYLTARLLWDSNLEIDKLMDEYCRTFYGPAAGTMREFWDFAANLWQNKKSSDASYLYTNVYNETNVKLFVEKLNVALSQVPADSKYHKRISLLKEEIIPLDSRVRNARVYNIPKFTCEKVDKPPILDGSLTDPCWRKAAALDFVGRQGEWPKYPSKAKIVYDDHNIYFGIENYDNKTGRLRVSGKADSLKRPYLWEDDSIEIFLNPYTDNDKYYKQFIVNAAGEMFDAEFEDGTPSFEAVKWNSDSRSATAVTPDTWVLEMKIPLKDIGVRSGQKKLLMNIIRNRNCGEELVATCWSPTLTGDNNNQARFGELVLGDVVSRGNDKKNIFRKETFGPEFKDAYALFKRSRTGAGNRFCASYSDAADKFCSAAEGAENPMDKTRAELFACLCEFLDLDFSTAVSICGKLSERSSRVKSIMASENAGDLTDDLLALNKMDLSETQLALAKKLLRIADNAETISKFRTEISLDIYDDQLRIELADKRKIVNTACVLAVMLDDYALSTNMIMRHVDQANCALNLCVIGAELYLYAQNHNGKLPLIRNGKDLWCVTLLKTRKGEWDKRPIYWKCPTISSDGYNYGMNACVSYKYKGELAKIPKKSDMILLADSVHYAKGDYPHKPNYSGAAFQILGPYEHDGVGTADRKRHMEGVNILFADGHVEWLPAEEIPVPGTDLIWTGESK